ncbi:MraY family glycosyltransferase [Solicola sp. PLA-1-18]|uniref:MraY family glycosyltransferase n=1 Tax=Solicola sp. PLA-1-18 TaxID=3380532 RepID=UPI003B7D30CB
MREYLAVFGVAVAVTWVLAVAARELAIRYGATARVRERDVHAVPIPYFGGVAMLGGLLAAFLVANHLPFLSRSYATVLGDALPVMVGGTVICLVGVVDDLFELDALSKFAGQVLAGVIAVAMGVQFLYLPFPGNYVAIDPVQSLLFSVFLIVLTANAVNFVDGLDGLASGVVAIGALALFLYAFLVAVESGETRAVTTAFLTAALAGACVGILPHNFFPARMFIGDSGSMLLGFVLACSAISLTGQFSAASVTQDAQASLLPTLLPLVLPFTILLIPFLDLLLAVVRRTRAGRSPFSPDKMHLHHRLLEIGHSHRRAVVVMYAIAALVAFGSVVVSLYAGWRAYLGFGVLAAATAFVVFWLPRWRRAPVR